MRGKGVTEGFGGFEWKSRAGPSGAVHNIGVLCGGRKEDF